MNKDNNLFDLNDFRKKKSAESNKKSSDSSTLSTWVVFAVMVVGATLLLRQC